MTHVVFPGLPLSDPISLTLRRSVCVCVYAHVCSCVCMHVVWVHTRVSVLKCARAYMPVFVRVCIFVFVSVCVCVLEAF